MCHYLVLCCWSVDRQHGADRRVELEGAGHGGGCHRVGSNQLHLESIPAELASSRHTTHPHQAGRYNTHMTQCHPIHTHSRIHSHANMCLQNTHTHTSLHVQTHTGTHAPLLKHTHGCTIHTCKNTKRHAHSNHLLTSQSFKSRLNLFSLSAAIQGIRT